MGAFLRKYATGTGADVYVPIIKRGVVDYALSADYTPANGDVKISIDGGAAANIGTLPVAVTMGNTAYWKFVFTNAELTGKVMIVTVADAATKAVEDQAFIIETYGHASAMYQADLSAANLPANVTQWLGTAAATPTVAGVPKVDVTHLRGTASAGDAGYVGTDQAKITNATATQNLSGTTVLLADNAITTAAINDGAITSAKFTVAAITGVATGILEKIEQLWRRFFKKSTLSATELKTFADDGSTVVTTQTVSDTAGTETQGEAS